MTNVQLYLALGIPFFSLLVAMVISNSRTNHMRDLLHAEIQTLRTETLGEFKVIHTELTEQRRMLDRIILGLDMLTGKVVEIHNRLSRLEERMDRS